MKNGTATTANCKLQTANCRKAVVLAAGFGTRLRPFTASVPKPLLPVWGEPMLARVVAWLREQGVEDIVVNCHYLHEQIEDWCAKNGCRAIYEPEILGTGGVLNPLRDWIGDDDFYLINGDIVFDLPEPSPFAARNSKLETRNSKLIGCCIVTEDGPRTIEVEPDDNLVTNWHSPDPGWNGTWTYCGIALLTAKILDYVKRDGFSSIIEAYEAAMMDGNFIKAVAPENLLWTDAGTVESYIALNQDGDDNAFADIPQIRASWFVPRASCLGERASFPEPGDCEIKFLGARGSDRAFFRIRQQPGTNNEALKDAYIIVYDDEKRPENARYAGHARWLKEHGIHVPEVLADCPQMKTLALENAGATDLKERAKTRGEDRLYDYVAVVEELAKFNSLAGEARLSCQLEPPFDAALYKWERDLFREHCLGTRFHTDMPEAVEKELEAVAERLQKEPPALVHRDFQSTNVMFRASCPVPRASRGNNEARIDEPRGTDATSASLPTANCKLQTANFSIIDFQGMRIGPAAYDLASLLYDPYVDLREGERRALAALYAKKAGRPEIVDVLPYAAVERLVQALGAFGRLASVGKPEFGKFVLPALQNLLAAADDAGLDSIGALAEDLIARETKNDHDHTSCLVPRDSCLVQQNRQTANCKLQTANCHHHHHDGCGCGHHHHGEQP